MRLPHRETRSVPCPVCDGHQLTIGVEYASATTTSIDVTIRWTSRSRRHLRQHTGALRRAYRARQLARRRRRRTA